MRDPRERRSATAPRPAIARPRPPRLKRTIPPRDPGSAESPAGSRDRRTPRTTARRRASSGGSAVTAGGPDSCGRRPGGRTVLRAPGLAPRAAGSAPPTSGSPGASPRPSDSPTNTPRPPRIAAVGTNRSTAMIGPICSMAREKRSSRSRPPVLSNAFIIIRQRSQANALRILSIPRTSRATRGPGLRDPPGR